MMARVRERDDAWAPALSDLRAICAPLPGVVETVSFGNPTFKAAGKPFVVLDSYKGATCVWLACGAERRAVLLQQAGFFAAPYDRAGAAICRTAAGIDWPEFSGLVRDAYEATL